MKSYCNFICNPSSCAFIFDALRHQQIICFGTKRDSDIRNNESIITYCHFYLFSIGMENRLIRRLKNLKERTSSFCTSHNTVYKHTESVLIKNILYYAKVMLQRMVQVLIMVSFYIKSIFYQLYICQLLDILL